MIEIVGYVLTAYVIAGLASVIVSIVEMLVLGVRLRLSDMVLIPLLIVGGVFSLAFILRQFERRRVWMKLKSIIKKL